MVDFGLPQARGDYQIASCDLDRLGEIASRVIFRTDFCL
jgi:hypothetical protein